MTDDNKPAPQLELQRIYLKDASLETPNSPQIFSEQGQPQTSLQLNTAANTVAEQVHEVILTLTVTTKVGEQTAYLVEIQQAGLFMIKGLSPEQMGQALHAYCPNVLFPFARETLASLVGKGGFPPILLNPVNFDALYAQRVRAAQQQAEQPPS